MMGLLDSARYYFQLYLQHYRKYRSCYSNLAIGYARINELDSALMMCDNTLNVMKQCFSLSNENQLHAYRQEYEKALATADELIALQPEKSAGYKKKQIY